MIILECICEKKKLRIKFNSFIDDNGNLFTNVYNNDYNCQFPKDIRIDGQFYEIKDDDMNLICDGLKTPFYKINKKNIRILSEEECKKYRSNKKTESKIDISNMKIYDEFECVICLTENTSLIFIPCAHCCVCNSCYETIKKIKNCCPLCRKNIKNVLNNTIKI